MVTLHNAYCAKGYHWQCQYDNDEEGYCRELNNGECQAIRSNTGTNGCRSLPHFRTRIYKWGTEPCHYCGQILGMLNLGNDCGQDIFMGGGEPDISFDCDTPDMELKSYKECSNLNKNQCGSGEFTHCKWENKSGEQAEHGISICVDSDGNQVADALCTENKLQCGGDIIINRCTQHETPKIKCFETDESCQRYGGSRGYDRTACYVMDEFCYCTGVI